MTTSTIHTRTYMQKSTHTHTHTHIHMHTYIFLFHLFLFNQLGVDPFAAASSSTWGGWGVVVGG